MLHHELRRLEAVGKPLADGVFNHPPSRKAHQGLGLRQNDIPQGTVSERLELTVDNNSFHEYDRDMRSKNPIQFPGYGKNLEELSEGRPWWGRSGL